MNLKNLTKMCASFLLAIMIVGMPLYLVGANIISSDGVNVNENQYGYYEFSMNIWSVNDAPYIINDESYLLKMTKDTVFVLPEPIDISYLFADVDSVMSFSWISLNHKCALNINGSLIESITTFGAEGSDVITIIATDGEYVTMYDFYLFVEPRKNICMTEDIALTYQLGSLVDIETEEFKVFGSANISATGFTNYSTNSAWIQLTPSKDWFGEDTISLYIYPILNSIPSPPIDPSPQSGPPGIPIYPPVPNYIEFSYYEFDVSVKGVNDPPVLIATPTISMIRNTPLPNAFNIKDCFTDVDSQLTYAIESGPGSSVVASIAMNGSVSLTPALNWFGTFPLIISASDEEYTVIGVVNVNVAYENYKPTILEAESLSIDEDTNLKLFLEDYIMDIDQTLTYSYSSSNEHWIGILNETERSLTIIPEQDWSGEINITIYGWDGEFEVALNLTLNVLPVNDPPVALYQSVEMAFDQGTTLEIALVNYFHDVDSELEFIAYSMDGNVHASVSGSKLTLTPGNGWWGSDVVVVAATDGEYIVKMMLNTHVQHVNRAPVVNVELRRLMMRENTEMTLILGDLFTDPDGDELVYGFELGGGISLAFDSSTNLLRLIPAENWNGASWLSISAWDGQLYAVTDVILIVVPVNKVPVQVSEFMVLELLSGEATVIDLSVHFTDPDGAFLTYELEGSEHVTITPLENNGMFRVEVSEEWSGAENLKVTVSDGTETLNSYLTLVASMPQTTEEANTGMNAWSSMGWMGVGIVIALVAFAMYTTTENRNARTRTATNKGRVL